MGGAPVIEWLRPGVGYQPVAAASMRRLEHRLGRLHDCNSSYRDWGKQLSMFEAWNRYVQSGKNPALYPGHSRALHPDLSMHCKGLADDSDDWRTPGYIDLAAEYGWVRTAAGDPTEQHHFEYQWWNDQHRTEPVPADSGAVDFDPSREAVDDMPKRINNTDTGAAYLFGDTWIRHMVDPATAQANQRAYGPAVDLDAADFRRVHLSMGCSDADLPAGGRMWRATAQVTPAQVKMIADATAAKIGVPALDVDYDALADAVNDESDRRARKRLDSTE